MITQKKKNCKGKYFFTNKENEMRELINLKLFNKLQLIQIKLGNRKWNRYNNSLPIHTIHILK